MEDIKQQAKEIWGLKIGTKSNQFDQEKVLFEIINLAVKQERERVVCILSNEWCKNGRDTENRNFIDTIITLITNN